VILDEIHRLPGIFQTSGTGKTKTAWLWTYVRDDRPAGGDVPPAVWFTYSEDREEEIRSAMKFYFTETHNVVEGAGAAGLAAALKEKQMLQGRCVGLVATGGNVDHDVFARVLLD
jgi:Transposase IS66 family